MNHQPREKSVWSAAAGMAAVITLIAVVFGLLRKETPPPPGNVKATPAADEAVPGPLIGKPSPDSLIHWILNPPPPLDYRQLLSRIDLLPDTLTGPESMTVCQALRRGLTEYRSLPQAQQHHLANQLMDALLRQQTRGGWLAAELTAIWRSGKADETVRDYALQHLAQLMEGRRSPSVHLAAWRADGLPVLLAAARDTRQRSAGTALLALHFLTSDTSGRDAVPLTELNDLVDHTVSDVAAHPAARAAAIQVAAARSRQTLLPEARQLVSRPDTPPGVRLSAIHYLGSCGGTDDQPILASVAAENDPRYTAAAVSARGRLTARAR